MEKTLDELLTLAKQGELPIDFQFSRTLHLHEKIIKQYAKNN